MTNERNIVYGKPSIIFIHGETNIPARMLIFSMIGVGCFNLSAIEDNKQHCNLKILKL